ncbi:bifunctional type I 3-dehydroquinate dehydratase/shikimate dehydrogenase [Stratiformator vulcanicus]|uniref:3-dehydroquinate dehydratase n=1 Tax=Stratiformator vulcanicus TaxID=2527980 RepID=A0A517QVY5_9PLAN|nr:bifunctional type I 3-dehydroquinate dehydratase/shikimate dehydrogenase [Stratiformator vulcanicus]QDT35754.1 3-dehydroquinate dehydratase [Stratiformator vulcanicus]
MICVSVTSSSRQLIKVDLLNAARSADMVEVCVDHLIKEPDYADIYKTVDKPILVSCRRAEDGGAWQGTEDERLVRLRQAIVAGPDYVELELDIAGKIPRFGSTQRVISYTCKKGILGNVDEVFAQAKKVHADVVKFVWPTPTLNAAWPLLAAVTKKRDLPVVGTGVGEAGTTFSLLARKYDSPWVYASLEKGMEAHADLVTVHELDEVYRWDSLNRKTPFVALTGFGSEETALIESLNERFAEQATQARCLPMPVGKMDKLSKMLEVLGIETILVGPLESRRFCEFADRRDGDARATGTADVLRRHSDGWHASNSFTRLALNALEDVLPPAKGETDPLARRQVLLIAGDDRARAIGRLMAGRAGMINVTSIDDDFAKTVARELDARYISFRGVYESISEIIVIADPNLEIGPGRLQLNPGFFRPNMTVLDLIRTGESVFLKEAVDRESRVVGSEQIRAALTTAYAEAIRT